MKKNRTQALKKPLALEKSTIKNLSATDYESVYGGDDLTPSVFQWTCWYCTATTK